MIVYVLGIARVIDLSELFRVVESSRPTSRNVSLKSNIEYANAP